MCMKESIPCPLDYSSIERHVFDGLSEQDKTSVYYWGWSAVWNDLPADVKSEIEHAWYESSEYMNGVGYYAFD